MGGGAGELFEVWNIEHPERVEQVARSYVAAGAQIILTNTFSCNPMELGKHGLAERGDALNAAGVEISRRAAQGSAYVFASVGSCGKMVAMGEVEASEVEESAARQAGAIARAGADAIVIETQTDLVEAEAILRGCLRASELPVGVSFALDCGVEGDRTMMGNSIAEIAAMAAGAGASFVGANCGASIEKFGALAQKFAAQKCGLPIWVKGNAGVPQIDNLATGESRYGVTPADFAEAAGAILDAGARFVGGCCGSTPAHIRALRDAMQAWLIS